jgi:hypothetical protein
MLYLEIFHRCLGKDCKEFIIAPRKHRTSLYLDSTSTTVNNYGNKIFIRFFAFEGQSRVSVIFSHFDKSFWASCSSQVDLNNCRSPS